MTEEVDETKTEAIEEENDEPSQIELSNEDSSEDTSLDPVPLQEYLFPEKRPWVWKSFVLMFVAFYGYYYIQYSNLL